MADNVGGVFNNAGFQFQQENRMSIVNLELGQRIPSGEKWMMRLLLGIQFANLAGYVNTLNDVRLNTFKNDMEGARIGLDLAYEVFDGLAIYDHTAIGALIQCQLSIWCAKWHCSKYDSY